MWKSVSMAKCLFYWKTTNQMTAPTWCRIAHFISNYSTSSSVRQSHEPEESLPTLEELNKNDLEIDDRCIGLTPKAHYDNLRKKPDQPPDSRILRLAVIGLPNAGKSTLINRLMSWKVTPVSSKVHTTRKNTSTVLTEDNSQIVFVDTPGLLSASCRKKHNVDKSLFYDPERGVQSADLIAVLVDVSDKWTRDGLDQKVLKVLYLHKDKPSILVLNKVDAMKSKIMLLPITKQLTEGIVGGKSINFKTAELKRERANFDVKGYLRKIDETIATGDIVGTDTNCDDKTIALDNNEVKHRWEKSGYKTPVFEIKVINKEKKTQQMTEYQIENNETVTENQQETSDKIKIAEKGTKISDPEEKDHALYLENIAKTQSVAKYVKGRDGWPKFEKVFMISALEDDGVSDLKNYLLNRAKPGDWVYHSSVVVDENPLEIAKQLVWEKVLDNSSGPAPYNVKLEIVLWEVEDGLLKIIIDLRLFDERQFRNIMGIEGRIIEKISKEAKQELMNAFRCDIQFRLQVKFGVQTKRR